MTNNNAKQYSDTMPWYSFVGIVEEMMLDEYEEIILF